MSNPFRAAKGRMVAACRDAVKCEILGRVEKLKEASTVDGDIIVVEHGNTFTVVPLSDEYEYRLEEYGNSQTQPKRLWKKHLSDQ